MEETLRMIFKNQEGRNVAITVPDPDSELTALAVETVIDIVITHNIFTTSGEVITEKVHAEVAARSVDVLAAFEA